MRFLFLWIGMTYLLSDVVCDWDKNRICYHAKICIHNGSEKCGVDKQGNVRRFLDSCDMMEYNCLKKTEFEKCEPQRCESLPALRSRKSKKIQERLK